MRRVSVLLAGLALVVLMLPAVLPGGPSTLGPGTDDLVAERARASGAPAAGAVPRICVRPGVLEDALFALQAAIGGGVLGFVLGARRRAPHD